MEIIFQNKSRGISMMLISKFLHFKDETFEFFPNGSHPIYSWLYIYTNRQTNLFNLKIIF